MKINLTVFVNTALLFAAIGFVTYLLIIAAGFLGCCAGISSGQFYMIILILATVATLIFGVCMIKNCYLNIKK